MSATSSYLKYLPPVLWSPPPPAGVFDLGAMLCAFEKILTGIDDGLVISHGDDAVVSAVTQNVTGAPLPQTIRVKAGTGTLFRVGASYTFNGAAPEVIAISAVTTNTITAVVRQNHVTGQTLVNSSGAHQDIQSVIAGLVKLYSPWTTPSDNFDWLAQWVALQADPMWDDYQRRSVLSKIVGIYSQRGTKPGFDQFFGIYALAKQRPRVVVDNASKILFCQPQAGLIAPVPTLVSQQPLIAPQCMAIDASGYLLVGDLGSGGGSTVKPAVWRISPAGDYDYSAGPPAAPQPYQTATAPIAIAADGVNGGAYLIDFVTDYSLYRLTNPQVGVVTLSGTPTPGEFGTFVIDGTAYTFPETGGPGLDSQAAAWGAALNVSAPFNTRYVANSLNETITITTLAGGDPADDLLTTTSSASLQMTATGPSFGVSTLFAGDAPGPPPPLGLIYPKGMVVNAAGEPLILDRGATINAASATAMVEVQIAGAPPSYTGNLRHALPAIVEPLSLLQRADGSLIIGDGADQRSAKPADLFTIDPATWTATSLLSGVAAGDNPLVSPVGVVEVDAQHLLVLDAGLRPYVPSIGTTAFTVIIAQQAAIYGVDLSVVPPVITRASEFEASVYPRAMVGDGQGNLFICDSGLPDLAGYSARLWRSQPQQMSVVVHFQGDPARSIASLTLSGTPTSGEQCGLSLGPLNYVLTETSGDTLAQQAQAWAETLNADATFNPLYIALATQNLVCIYAASNTNANGVPITTTSSASMSLTAGLLATAVTLTGTPTTGENIILNIGGLAHVLSQTTGETAAQQAQTWATTLNAIASFSQVYLAAATDAVISIYYASDDVADTLPVFVASSIHLTASDSSPPLVIGSLSLFGAPTTGETCVLTLGLATFNLIETSGFTPAQQAAAWVAALNGTAAFSASYTAMNAGATLNLFAAASVSVAGKTLSATSTPHLTVQAYSEHQNRSRFLQSIRDVVSDEIPAHARWYLQSELSQQ